MALIIADRVRTTSYTAGTGTYNLEQSPNGFQNFEDVMAADDTCYYVAEFSDDWEVGVGTFKSFGSYGELERTTILGSSNSGSAVVWGTGTRVITMSLPAKEANIIADNELNNAGLITATIETFDLNDGRNILGTIGADTELRFSNVRDPVDLVFLELTNPGAFALTITNAIYEAGTSPTWTTSGVDLVGLKTFDGGITWHAAVLQDMK